MFLLFSWKKKKKKIIIDDCWKKWLHWLISSMTCFVLHRVTIPPVWWLDSVHSTDHIPRLVAMCEFHEIKQETLKNVHIFLDNHAPQLMCMFYNEFNHRSNTKFSKVWILVQSCTKLYNVKKRLCVMIDIGSFQIIDSMMKQPLL